MQQFCPIVVRYFSDQEKKVVAVLLSLKECTVASTGQNIYLEMDEELKRPGLSWDQILAFRTDNANVMVGWKNGVAAHIKNQNPNCLIAGCSCHLLHIDAKLATSCFCQTFGVEDLVTDVYYYLHRSSKRQQNLYGFQEIYNDETRKVIKHVSTRWLSVTRCVERLLRIWDALIVFFRAERETSSNKVYM